MINMLKVANVTIPPSPLVSLPTPYYHWEECLHTSQMAHSSQIKPGTPNTFDSGRAKGCTFLTSLELYLVLTGLDFPDDQSCIHRALSYFKSRHTATFAEHVVRQEMGGGQMVFADWDKFTLEFILTFFPENEATAALMRLESDHYFQGRHNINTYINKFKDLINMSGYMDPIAIVLKFHWE
jgi:hypothetical protein